MLLNSLDALKNRRDPSIDISIGSGTDSTKLTFSDNGTGIEPAAISQVFNTFYSSKPNAGIGLGLSMVKRIVEMYGGTVSVSSEIGKGSTFEIIWNRSK